MWTPRASDVSMGRPNPAVDYLNPTIADADAGHGGLTESYLKWRKMLVEAGASGAHIEDQVLGTKCGHMSGELLVITDEHANRPIALRWQVGIFSYPMALLRKKHIASVVAFCICSTNPIVICGMANVPI